MSLRSTPPSQSPIAVMSPKPKSTSSMAATSPWTPPQTKSPHSSKDSSMSMTESATEQNLANAFAEPPEAGDVQAGNPLPIGGAHQQGGGVNFVLFSRHATAVRLEFYQHS